MEEEYWHGKWQAKEIAFHEGKPNVLFVKHFSTTGVAAGGRVFVPLCGKSRDLHWLLEQGYEVVGAELSELAIQELFAELGVQPAVEQVGTLKRYAAKGITVFSGNLFELTKEMLGKVDAVYDRAALVALPPEMRDRYALHLVELTEAAPQLLICFEYDPALMAPPPHSVGEDEVRRQYEGRYLVRKLDEVEVAGGLKGICPATEVVWELNPR